MIILLGKHQFTISSIDDAPSTSTSFVSGSGKNAGLRKSGLNSEAILSLVENAEKIISDFSLDHTASGDKIQLSERL